MKNYFLIAAACATMFTACKRESKLHSITYSVRENTTAQPVYTVTYTDSNGNTRSLGNLSGANWTSESIDRKSGDFVSINLSSQDPSGSFEFFILSDGAVIQEGTMTNPNGNVTISTKVP